MASPYFFESDIPDADELGLNENSSRHICQVLRMQEGEQIILTNGKGYTVKAMIVNANKKFTRVRILSKEFNEISQPQTCIAISLIKSNNRFEWFVEKATELGISRIIPLICRRTEKAHFKKERIVSILISAMLQSQQSWLPELSGLTKFDDLVKGAEYDQKFIAHCLETEKKQLKNQVLAGRSKIILVGPEGDFTNEEVETALQNNYMAVSLGETRLRTETAGIVSAVLIK